MQHSKSECIVDKKSERREWGNEVGHSGFGHPYKMADTRYSTSGDMQRFQTASVSLSCTYSRLLIISNMMTMRLLTKKTWTCKLHCLHKKLCILCDAKYINYELIYQTPYCFICKNNLDVQNDVCKCYTIISNTLFSQSTSDILQIISNCATTCHFILLMLTP